MLKKLPILLFPMLPIVAYYAIDIPNLMRTIQITIRGLIYYLGAGVDHILLTDLSQSWQLLSGVHLRC